MIALVVVLAVFAIAPQLHLAAMAVAHFMAGLTPKVVSFGIGPTLLERPFGRTTLRLAALPIGGFVQMPDGPDGQPLPIPPFFRAAIALAGPLWVLVVAIPLGARPMGFDRAALQLLEGAWAPLEVGAPLVSAWIAHAEHAPLHAGAALAVRLALFNLLPLPSLNGFDVIEGLVVGALGRPARPRSPAMALIGALLVLPISIAWIVAIVTALSSP
ncbi:MAG: site-2 protease family protein [Deltaproteobacteria bacterium]|nr:site-2 protease family protein [Deltaproteobacteria bacterium]